VSVDSQGAVAASFSKTWYRIPLSYAAKLAIMALMETDLSLHYFSVLSARPEYKAMSLSSSKESQSASS